MNETGRGWIKLWRSITDNHVLSDDDIPYNKRMAFIAAIRCGNESGQAAKALEIAILPKEHGSDEEDPLLSHANTISILMLPVYDDRAQDGSHLL